MPLNMYVHIYVLPGSAWLVSLGNLTNIIFILAWGIIFAVLFGVVRSPRFPHPAILSIIGMGIVLLIFSLGGSGHEIPTTQKVLPIKPSEGTSPVAGRKVILLGLDGVNQRVLNRLFEQADLPNLQAMFNRGISSPLETVTPTFSPLIWTTIASGLPWTEHGISAFTRSTFLGLDTPVDMASFPQLIGLNKIFALYETLGIYSGHRDLDSRSVAVPRIWDIVSHYGGTSLVVNWYVTDPPNSINGLMVSDLFLQTGRISSQPVELEKEFDEVLKVIPEAAISRKNDWIAMELSKGILERVPPEYFDFIALYVSGPDRLQHRYWNALFPEDYINPPDAGDGFQEISTYYEWLDSNIGRLQEILGPEWSWMVVSDHGFTGQSKLWTSFYTNIPNGQHFLAPPGIFLFFDPQQEFPKVPDWGANIFQITPTVLSLLKIPVSQEFPDTPLLPLLRLADEQDYQVNYVPRYSTEDQPLSDYLSDKPANEELLERLRALGYID